jgi:hypothetical protein
MKQIKKNSRHVRWNWEVSPEQDLDNHKYVRYHFIVVDDKDREGLMGKILVGLSKYAEVIPIRRVEGKVSGSEFRYLFSSYDSIIKPDMIEWQSLKRDIKRDSDLRERKQGNIEDYVARVYDS